eukprot:m.530222 g.530222  ORF g.530222 m.530222 type:complete len:925 (+) comp22026_c1_seq6:340-3114(+)
MGDQNQGIVSRFFRMSQDMVVAAYKNTDHVVKKFTGEDDYSLSDVTKTAAWWAIGKQRPYPRLSCSEKSCTDSTTISTHDIEDVSLCSISLPPQECTSSRGATVFGSIHLGTYTFKFESARIKSTPDDSRSATTPIDNSDDEFDSCSTSNDSSYSVSNDSSRESSPIRNCGSPHNGNAKKPDDAAPSDTATTDGHAGNNVVLPLESICHHADGKRSPGIGGVFSTAEANIGAGKNVLFEIPYSYVRDVDMPLHFKSSGPVQMRIVLKTFQVMSLTVDAGDSALVLFQTLAKRAFPGQRDALPALNGGLFPQISDVLQLPSSTSTSNVPCASEPHTPVVTAPVREHALDEGVHVASTRDVSPTDTCASLVARTGRPTSPSSEVSQPPVALGTNYIEAAPTSKTGPGEKNGDTSTDDAISADKDNSIDDLTSTYNDVSTGDAISADNDVSIDDLTSTYNHVSTGNAISADKDFSAAPAEHPEEVEARGEYTVLTAPPSAVGGVCVTDGITQLNTPATQKSRWENFDLRAEYARMGITEAWRCSGVNHDYRICSTYPQHLFVPAGISDEHLQRAAQYRSQGRLPVLAYYALAHGTALLRSAQPLPGPMNWRNQDDEELVAAACQAAHDESQPFHIFDARPKINAIANRAGGKGYETPGNYGGACRVSFLNIANIHIMRKSIEGVMTVASTASVVLPWLRSRENGDVGVADADLTAAIGNTQWLHHVRQVLLGVHRVVLTMTQNRRSVLVHCSDGWDRTAQLVALAQILMDPYFRTLDGFRVLVQKEWLAFGHKFEQRLASVHHSSELSPVFTQFLDCVWQLMQQHPTEFEFSARFLLDLHTAIQSGFFGNFLCNSDKERYSVECLHERTPCLWKHLARRATEGIYQNPHFMDPADGPAVPLAVDTCVGKILFFADLYVPLDMPTPSF